MKVKSFYYIMICIIANLLMGCDIELEPINYGKDQCHYCKMNIVDKAHAAQYVTQKGKNYKFDAIECMILNLKELDNNSIGLLGVSDYQHPGSMIDAKSATYIVSPEIKSPMGANLSAVTSIQQAKDILSSRKGKSYNWTDIQKVIKK